MSDKKNDQDGPAGGEGRTVYIPPSAGGGGDAHGAGGAEAAGGADAPDDDDITRRKPVEDDDTTRRTPSEQRTVYQPPEPAPPHDPPPPPPPAPPAAGATEDRTVYMPPPADSPAPRQATSSPTVVAPTNFTFAPRTDGQAIQVGDVLNHIYEVKRFIARGGMGEVFEGVNVNSDERVAIKVMLPALAADVNVVAMFRKEARTLTRLQHEALVQYRVLAQEPQLGVLYIVTEYVDGVNLADVLGKIKPSPAELRLLLAKLAAGLRVAHALGAVHRDMSPDNVLLEGGELGGAKIIDFGIAKDLDPSSKTIIGEGFAGKLNYVAPEQLGDYNREVGPWTDVYSLALVILAVAMGKNVQMGGSLVDAVDKRRAGPDLSGAPEELRPVLAKMLKANPKERLRSMDEVLAELGQQTTMFAPGGPGGRVQAGPSKGVLIGGGAAVLALVGGLGWLAFAPGEEKGPARDPVQLATGAVQQVLPNVECSWLDVASVQGGERVAVRMTGVAGNATAARNQIAQALTAAGVPNADINLEEVAIIQPQGCSALQTIGRIRKPGEKHMSVEQREFEMVTQPPGSDYAVASLAEITLKTPEGKDFSLFGLEPKGLFSPLIENRQALEAFVAQFREVPPAERLVEEVGPGTYRLRINMDHRGWSGLVLLTGEAPFDPAVTQPAIEARGEEWQNNFVATASEREWRSEMIWFRSVDKVPNS